MGLILIKTCAFVALFSAVCAVQSVFLDEIKDTKQCKLNLLAEAHRRFAFNLYTRVSSAEGSGKNVLLSPMVVNMGLSMLLMGAAGSSKGDLMTSLALNDYAEKGGKKEGVGCIFERYRNIARNSPMTLATAGNLFSDKTLAVDYNFLGLMGMFGAKMRQVDFANNTEIARQTINDWVSQHTGNRIPDLFPEGSIETTTKLVLATALYFKGEWRKKFRSNETGTFYLSQDETVNAQYMADTFDVKFMYDATNELDFVELPYVSLKGDMEVSMILIKDRSSFDAMVAERKLNARTLRDSLDALFAKTPTEADVIVPMFEVRGDYDLKPHLEDMGMRGLFQAGLADLSGINGKHDLYLNSAKHKTFLKVDPEGSEAAAAAGFGIVALSLPPRMVFNKAFTYLLYEKTTKTILFMGRLANPNLG